MLVKILSAMAVLVGGALVVADLAHAQAERSGKAVYEAQCSKCHATGVDGAPKIDDRSAWIPRMKDGLNATVRSAARGHGKMPARGGVADLTDSELRAAILYMFYPAAADLKPRDAEQRDPNHKHVGGLDLYLGITPAALAPAEAKGPRSKGYYYVTVSVHDGGSVVKDAQVEARAANAVTGGETKKLAAVTLNNAPSYGGFFRMEGSEPYAITVRVRRPKEDGRIETRFDFKP